MKRISIHILFLFLNFSSFSQTLFADSSIIKNFGKEHLKDCQIISKLPQAIKCSDTSRLTFSYEFNSNGCITKKIKSEWSQTDTNLTIYTYDNSKKILSRENFSRMFKYHNLSKYEYDKYGKITTRMDYYFNGLQKDTSSKMIYFYNNKQLLEKIIYQEFYPKSRIFDTSIFQTFTYNSKGLKETETMVKSSDYYEGRQGFSTFKYDEKGRLIELNHKAFRGKNNEISDSTNNFVSYYTYSGDSLTIETVVYYNYDSFLETTTLRNKDNKVIKTILEDFSGIEFKNTNGKYLPDRTTKTADIHYRKTSYEYDKLGRIYKTITDWKDDNKLTGWKTESRDFKIFIYKEDKRYILPEEEYVDAY